MSAETEAHTLVLTHDQFNYLLRLVQRDAKAHLADAEKGKEALGAAEWLTHLTELGDLLEVFVGPEVDA